MRKSALGFLAIAVLALVASAQPVITSGGVQNAFGNEGQLKLTPGCFFVVKGTGLGPAQIVVSSAVPNYPTTIGGTSVSFTPAGGGTAVVAKMYYSLATQVAGILPSTITPGNYNVVVTYNGQNSAPAQVTVVARAFGIATANSGGNGPAQATIYDAGGALVLDRFTTGAAAPWTWRPAHPGDILVLWGTGGGADLANDTGGSGGDQRGAGQFKVIVGGVEIDPLYAGTSSGYPGLWQVNFTLPTNIGLGCSVTVQVRTGSGNTTELSNVVTIAIAAAGQNACSSPVYNQATLAKLDAGGSITVGHFDISKVTTTLSINLGGFAIPITTTAEGITGSFSRYTASTIADQNYNIVNDQCVIFRRSGAITDIQYGAVPVGLDAGATLPVSGPNLTNASLARDATSKSYSLPSGTSFNVGAGTYQLTGSGGTEVGAFSASVAVPGSFEVTNFAGIGTISRSNPLTVTWTGGGNGTVTIAGHSMRTISGSYDTPATWRLSATSFACTFPASRGTGTVPVSVLSQMQVIGNDLTSGNFGFLTVTNNAGPSQGTFTAPLVGGGQTDFAALDYTLGVGKNVAYQ